MHAIRHLFISVIISSLAITAHAQTSAWKSATYGKLSLHYPPTWQLTRDDKTEQTRITLTPDSMKNLAMGVFAVYELPTSTEHTYTIFKENLTPIVQAATAQDAKVVKIEETTFKGHKCMHAEIISGSLTSTFYGIDAGTAIYLIFSIPRQHGKVADPGLERDEKAILNSITLAQ